MKTWKFVQRFIKMPRIQNTRHFSVAYIQGEPRNQSRLFADSLEDLVPEDHIVRMIDAYVARLDLARLRFDKSGRKGTGRPSYDPADQLKLYPYGYFPTDSLLPSA